MRLKKEVCLLVSRVLEETEVKGPLIELPLYLCDNGDYRNRNDRVKKPDIYKDIDIINNYEIIELLCYLEKKGIIKEIKDIIGYRENKGDFEIFTRLQFRKFNCVDTDFKCFTVLIDTSKYDMLEYLESNSNEYPGKKYQTVNTRV